MEHNRYNITTRYTNLLTVTDLEGGEPAPPPPPLGRRTDAVTHTRSSSLMLNFDRSTVKHDTQNIQNDCHQLLSDSFRVREFHCRNPLRQLTCSLQRFPDPLAGLRDPTSNFTFCVPHISYPGFACGPHSGI